MELDKKIASEVDNIRRSLKTIQRLVTEKSQADRVASRRYREWCRDTVDTVPKISSTKHSDTDSRMEYHLRSLRDLLLSIPDEYSREKIDSVYHWCGFIDSKMNQLGRIKGEQIFPDPEKERRQRRVKK